MRIEIDTKEDLHNIKHIIQFLHTISSNTGRSKSYSDDSSYNMNSLFAESSTSSQQTPPATSPALFSMFDSSPSETPTPSTISSSSDFGLGSLFGSSSIDPKKDDEPGKDFLDSLQVY